MDDSQDDHSKDDHSQERELKEKGKRPPKKKGFYQGRFLKEQKEGSFFCSDPFCLQFPFFWPIKCQAFLSTHQ